jgi:YidC/Oxa1 family membrane protein insertase
MRNKHLQFIFLIIFILLPFVVCLFLKEGVNVIAADTNVKTDTHLKNEKKDFFVLNSFKVNDKISNYIEVVTDVFSILIDPYGGDISSLKLLKYPSSFESLDNAFSLLETTETRFHVIQTGLLSIVGPDSKQKGRSYYKSAFNFYDFTNEKDSFFVELQLNLKEQNIMIKKRFYFRNNSYLIKIKFFIENNSTVNYEGYLFGQLKQKYLKKETPWYKSFGEAQNYVGAALSTKDKLFTKISHSDMYKKNLNIRTKDGWIAFVEHYFVSSLIPNNKDSFNEFSTEYYKNNSYSISFIESLPIVVKPKKTKRVKLCFYAGPKISSELKGTAKGLELSIDYGILWFIAQPIFVVMKFINNNFTHNWGFSIIFVTFLIRLLFLPLSAYSFKAMARLRRIQPKISIVKEKYKDDKQKFGNELMSLYKKENVNPFGGCLPILIQIPVFISLYYVLLQSVELRMSPFILWIHDLSLHDPYYVLPILLGVSMFLQQKLNPQPTDAFQEKLLLFMPFVLTLLFLQFASGLVLYWFVNNIFSILQQLYIFKKHSDL